MVSQWKSWWSELNGRKLTALLTLLGFLGGAGTSYVHSKMAAVQSAERYRATVETRLDRLERAVTQVEGNQIGVGRFAEFEQRIAEGQKRQDDALAGIQDRQNRTVQLLMQHDRRFEELPTGGKNGTR